MLDKEKPVTGITEAVINRTRTGDSLAWMRRDAVIRLLPFATVVGVVWASRHPRWLGLSAGRARLQAAAGLTGSVLLFGAATAGQLLLTRRRRALKVPATRA